jgi:hypothetical protein
MLNALKDSALELQIFGFGQFIFLEVERSKFIWTAQARFIQGEARTDFGSALLVAASAA